MYSNEAERSVQDIYDDFKYMKNPLVSIVYTNICQRLRIDVGLASHMQPRLSDILY